MIYIVTGVLGGGKSLIAMSRIKKYLEQGARIATNMDLFVEHITDKDDSSSRIIRVPDFPTAQNLNDLGYGYDGAKTGKFNDDEAGLLVLDEAATWLNSRNYRDKGRDDFVKVCVHIRKRGWHLLLLVQHEDMLDKQARDALGEHVVYCQRLDRLKMPILGEWSKAFGRKEIKPPKVHVGTVKYKTASGMHTVDTWFYQGKDLYDAYNTCQIFERDNEIGGNCSILPAHYIYGRYTNDSEHKTRRLVDSDGNMPATQSRSAFFIGALLAGVLSWVFMPANEVSAQPDVVTTPKEKPKAKHPLDGVFITASVKHSKGFDYVFETADKVVYPEHLGYRVRYINPCKANLYSDSDSVNLTCNDSRLPEAKSQRREAADLSEGALDSVSALFGSSSSG